MLPTALYLFILSLQCINSQPSGGHEIDYEDCGCREIQCDYCLECGADGCVCLSFNECYLTDAICAVAVIMCVVLACCAKYVKNKMKRVHSDQDQIAASANPPSDVHGEEGMSAQTTNQCVVQV